MSEKKTPEERIESLEQQIRRLQREKKLLQKKKASEDRKKRDHAMIMVGTTVMTHFDADVKTRVIDSSDEEIKAWVHSLFQNLKDAGYGEYENLAPETARMDDENQRGYAQ